MNFIEKFLRKLAEFQYKHAYALIIVFGLITLFMIAGIPQIKMQSDLSASSPQDLPINLLNDRVYDKFGTSDAVLVVLTLDEDSSLKNVPKDIRDESIIHYISDVHSSLESESDVESITSVGVVFKEINNYDNEEILNVLKANSALNGFFSDDYKTTFLLVNINSAGGEERVDAVTELIDENLDGFAKPPGTKIVITGNPPMQITMLRILQHDAVFTLSIAFILIFLLLILLQRSFVKAILVAVPLSLGLIWTMGTMGWIGLEISVGTAGLGAMLLGLGVEYGVFMLERYQEGREKGMRKVDALKIAVPGVGSSIFGSGLTTTAGFLALTLSIMPVLQDMGLSLALGIIFCLFSAIFVAPVAYVVLERFEMKIIDGVAKSFNEERKLRGK